MLAGQTILVTGATGAIGQAIYRSLAREGARVVMHYGRNRAAAEALLAAIGGRGLCLGRQPMRQSSPETDPRQPQPPLRAILPAHPAAAPLACCGSVPLEGD